MSTDWRALCAELADTLERAQRALRFEGGCSDTTDNKRRALIARARAALLADTLERAQRALRFEGGCSDTTDNKRRALIARARAALAAGSDGPAVPEGREPASVVSEPSDEELDVLADEWLDWNLEGHRAFARAAIAADRARYRHQPAPPAAEGEVK